MVSEDALLVGVGTRVDEVAEFDLPVWQHLNSNQD